jgi:peptidoglycan/xylan/chitin deacetylase (PgdA/CDA1 family)
MARYLYWLIILAVSTAMGIVTLSPGLALAAPGRQPAVAKATLAGLGHPKTVVTFAWGGSLASQMPAVPILREYGMHGTFFAASGLLCQLSQAECATSSPYLSVRDLHEIAAAGDEIGGLSVFHEQLTGMPVAEAKREICDDRSNLIRLGFRVTDFAYPFAIVNPTLEALVRGCGYNAGLGTGTLRGAGLCDTCGWAENIPPLDPMDVRTPIEVNSVNTTWTARTYESIVTAAQRHGGGWIVFTIHDICPVNCALGTTPAILRSLLGWLKGQARHDVRVETMRQVIGGPMRSLVTSPAPRALPSPGVANASLAKAAGRQPVCFQEASYGGTDASFTYSPTGGLHGSAAETVRITHAGSDPAKLLQQMDLGLCAPSVSSGHAYTAGVWYKASGQTQIEIYRRGPLDNWAYWATSPAFPASASWRQAAWKTPLVPPGTTALSFGLTTTSVGTITTTDYSLMPAKSERGRILLLGLVAVLIAAALIARGHYRYLKFTKVAEAAHGDSVAARS